MTQATAAAILDDLSELEAQAATSSPGPL